MTRWINFIFLLAFLINSVCGQDHATPNATAMPTTSGAPPTTQHGTTMANSTTTGNTSTGAVDVCSDNAKRNVQDNLGRSFPQFATLTSNLTAPRDFYQKLFNQSFTKDSYMQYCNAYKTSRAELDKCPNTTAKALSLIQLSFPDYVCIKRVNEYSDFVDCLQKLNNNAAVYDCRKGNCSANEQNSAYAKYPPPNATKTQLVQYVVADCLYSRCVADCRKSAVEKTCGVAQTELELEALKVALSSAQSISQSLAALQTAASGGLQDIFPDECRDAASMSLRVMSAAGADYLSAAVNGTANLLQSIQDSTGGGMAGATTKRPGGGVEPIMKTGVVSIIASTLAVVLLLF